MTFALDRRKLSEPVKTLDQRKVLKRVEHDGLVRADEYFNGSNWGRAIEVDEKRDFGKNPIENVNKIIPALIPPSRIKRKLRNHLRELGFSRTNTGELIPPDNSKDRYRTLHSQH